MTSFAARGAFVGSFAVLVACGGTGSTDAASSDTGAGGTSAGGSSAGGSAAAGKAGSAGKAGASGSGVAGGSGGSSAGGSGGGKAGGGGSAGSSAGGSAGSSAGSSGSGGGKAGGGGSAGSSAGGSGAGGAGGSGAGGSGGKAGAAGASGAAGQAGAAGAAGAAGKAGAAGASGAAGAGGATVCVPGAVQACYDGPPSTKGIGVCKDGKATCKADGSGFGACMGEVLPTPELCDGTLNDENCNGQVNEGGAGCGCVPGVVSNCYDGPAGTQGVGLCKGGKSTCDATGKAGPCMGEVLPAPEVCDGTLNDESCNGQVNEGGVGCTCVPGSTASCYDGPPGTLGVGICVGGTHDCDATGTAYGACNGEITPGTESCATPEDDDCNGSNLVCNGANQDCSPTQGICEDACAPDLLGFSNVGCEFYPTVTANLVDSSIFHFAVTVSNDSPKTATINITKGASTITSTTVPANSVKVITLPWDATLKGPSSLSAVPFPSSVRVNQGAYRLLSDRPVSVYQFNPLEYTLGGSFSYSNDASLLLPTNAWTGKYRVAARHHFASLSGFYAVTASQNNTTVTLAAGPQTGQVKAGIAGISTTGTGTITMNAGDVIQLVTNGSASQSDPNDLTGALVTSDKPVQVIGGHQCIYIPDTTGYCDHIEESMFPIETLASSYVIAAPLIPTGGQTPKANMVRIISTVDATTLTYDPPQAGAPAAIASAGGWVEIQNTAADFRIVANQPVLVIQYMLGQDAGGAAGDPAMLAAVTTDQYRSLYTFFAPTNYQTNYVNVTAPTGATVTLDGAVVSGFTPIGTSGFGVARAALSNAGSGAHGISSSMPFGISVYGYGQYTSYWYAGGLQLIRFM